MIENGAKAVVNILEQHGTDIIFGYPGAAIAPFYDKLLTSSIKHVLVRNEQGGVHAASGYAKTTGKVGVCIATSGPGATNMITGIATAYMDSIPIVAITGQVLSSQIGKDVFQEADITGATAPFCKHNYLVKDASKLPGIINEAFMLASTGRPGPVLVDIPIDILLHEMEYDYSYSFNIPGYQYQFEIDEKQIEAVCQVINQSKKPLIIAGGGIISSGSKDILYKISHEFDIPVTYTLMAKGCLDDNYERNLGMLGSHGTYSANKAVHDCDLLLIAGGRVGDRSFNSASDMYQKKTIIHIDIDPAEIGKNITVDYELNGDARDFLHAIHARLKKSDREKWIVNRKKTAELESKFVNGDGTIDPKDVLLCLAKHIDDDAIITTEVGQNQIWAANLIDIKTSNMFVTSGGMGTMGYGLPASVGCKSGNRDKQVIAIEGDGSLQMSLQELGTIMQEDLDIKIILFNNCSLGMVRELQSLKFEKRHSGVCLKSNPDFMALFASYGFKGARLYDKEKIEEEIEKMLSYKGTYVLECIVDNDNPTIYR
ncbi:MAG: biosynthetic-type acetolactate synthase large subunit [Clostridia bacterium]|nr:biosynthetic-type acetolactate synthase large subunit [Clostridia bacterium]